VSTPGPVVQPTADISDGRADFKPECEVRFAVVMYGGVSLAIYINGVAQELLNMVRATAPDPDNANKALLKEEELVGAGKVYRKLGQNLFQKLSGLDPLVSATPLAIRTRFVVDVISGTSAGGINGVFLAKALAQDQVMDGLKQLWLSEGDLGKLLNDKGSLADLTGFELKKPQQSLLNSQRMYRKLLEALAQMDNSKSSGSIYRVPERSDSSPLVRELDLFTTTTDIEGIPLPIALSDAVVFERRYKNVYHFRYLSGEELVPRNDFTSRNDPFLAFAARCTSSFPFAFEPMCLNHILEVTENYPRYTGAKNYVAKWDHLFSDYMRPGLFDLDLDSRHEAAPGTLPEASDPNAPEKAEEDLRESFMSRAFGDGGYLDNKPFTYATSTLMRRFADGVIKRKLLYVEPSPEHPELLASNSTPPDFFKNVQAAVLDLPRQETIREDIDRLMERNRVLRRLNTFAREAEDDITADPVKPVGVEEFPTLGIDEMIKVYGIGYGPYHRLKVGEVTSLLAEIVTRAKGHDPESDVGIAIRELVAAWRGIRYTLKKNGSDPPENKFLFDFDLHFRFRRVVFLNRRTNDLLKLDPFGQDEEDVRTKRLLWRSLQHARGDHEILKNLKPDKVDPQIAAFVESCLDPKAQPGATSAPEFEIWLDTFCNELERLKGPLNQALNKLRATEEKLLGKVPESSLGKEFDDLRGFLGQVSVPWPQLKKILEVDGLARTNRAKEMCKNYGDIFDKIAKEICKILDLNKPEVTSKISADPLQPKKSLDLKAFPLGIGAFDKEKSYAEQGAIAARLCLLYYNKNFINYDMVTYPVEYGTGAGETNEVEVFRVSPEDTCSLMAERPGQHNKLAGRTLMSFGAFLDERWRRNDMLWGRLDGAERLICTVLALPDKIEPTKDETAEDTARREKIDKKYQQQADLIYEAHLGILCQEIRENNGDAVCRLLSNAVEQGDKASHVNKLVHALLHDEVGTEVAIKLSPERRAMLTAPQSFDRQLNAQSALDYISRSTTITGKMLEGLADQRGARSGKRIAVWVTRFGATFWNLITVSVPQSLPNLFFRHWLGIAYLLAALAIFGGIAISVPTVTTFGWKVFGIAVALHFISFVLAHYMLHGKVARSLLLVAVAFILVAFVVLGIIHFVQFLPKLTGQEWMELRLAAAAFAALATTVAVAEAIRSIKSSIARRKLKPQKVPAAKKTATPPAPSAQ
jgi:patatin-related protein